MSHRPEQVASVIRRAVQEQIQRGLHDPRVRGLISITRVTVDDDLSEACIAISVLPAEHEALTLAGLRSAAQHLQRRAREGLPLRRMPHLRFVLDDSLKRAAAADAALARAAGGATVVEEPAADEPAVDEPTADRLPPHSLEREPDPGAAD